MEVWAGEFRLRLPSPQGILWLFNSQVLGLVELVKVGLEMDRPVVITQDFL